MAKANERTSSRVSLKLDDHAAWYDAIGHVHQRATEAESLSQFQLRQNCNNRQQTASYCHGTPPTNLGLLSIPCCLCKPEMCSPSALVQILT
jgi:hypothetical protein